MEQQLTSFSTQYQGVAVGCSGGLDSTVLVTVISKIFCRHKINIDFAICHTNYGLRGKESQQDEQFVRDLAQKHGAKCFVQSPDQLPPQLPRESVQMWARRGRYAQFEELKASGWLICLAHHRDDYAENVLLRMCRGTSLSALGGMTLFANSLWRPLLEVHRESIQAYATRHKLHHRHDASNAMMKYSRNRIRLKVMPLLSSINDGANRHIAELGEDLHSVMSFVNSEIETRLRAHGQMNRLSSRALKGVPPAIQKQLIGRFLTQNGIDGTRLSRRLLTNIVAAVQKVGSGGTSRKTKIDIPSRYRLEIGEEIHLLPSASSEDRAQTLTPEPQPPGNPLPAAKPGSGMPVAKLET